MKLLEIDKTGCLKAIEQGRKTGDSYFRNQNGILSVGCHVWRFVVDDVLSKIKVFSFNKGKVIEVVVRIGSSLYFHKERDLYLSFHLVKIEIVFTGISI